MTSNSQDQCTSKLLVKQTRLGIFPGRCAGWYRQCLKLNIDFINSNCIDFTNKYYIIVKLNNFVPKNVLETVEITAY